MNYLKFIALALLPLAPALAQEIPEPPPAPIIEIAPETEPVIALDALIRLALENTPQLSIARANEEAARSRSGAARAFPTPILELTPGLGNREARDEEVILAQPLDLFGLRRARGNVADAELRRAQSETSLTEREMIVGVKNAATALFAAQEAEKLGEVQTEVAQLFLDAATRKAELGDAPPVQTQRAELELLRVQTELDAAQAERLTRRAALNLLIGRAPEAPLRVELPISSALTDLLRARPAATTTEAMQSTASPSAPATTAQAGGDLLQPDLNVQGSTLLPRALATRPDILGAQATLEAKQSQVIVIRRQRLPQIEIQARRSAFFGREGSYALRAVATVPIFDFGSNKNERRAAEAEVRAQQATIDLLQRRASTQVEQALIRVRGQRKTVERYRTGIVPLTVELLRKTQIGYVAGASTYLEVLEAQRALRQSQTEYLQALVGVRGSEADLESALGATPDDLMGEISNPSAPQTPEGVAAPGTVPEENE